MPDYATLADAARLAVVRSAGVCRQIQACLDRVRAITKDDKSPVTIADFASQAIVAMTLRERTGSGAMIAEEGSAFLRDPAHAAHLDAVVAAVRDVFEDADEAAVLGAIDEGSAEVDADAFWTLDPIDGTKGFLRGQQYAIALAFVHNGTPAVAAMGCPNLPVDLSRPLDEADPRGCLYWGVRGDGVYETGCDDPDTETIRMTRLDHAEGEEIAVCASVEAAHSSEGDTDRVLAWIEERAGHPVAEPVRLDSQCKYAVVARGQADAYLRLPTRKGYVERIWDHAAGAMIATEAGAAVTDIEGRDLDFTRGRGLERNRGIVCAPPRVHGLMLRAISDLSIANR